MTPPSSFALAALAGALLTSCSMSSFAADQAGGMAAKSASALRGFWDYEIAGHGNAAGIMQLEGVHALSPDNEQLTLTLCAAYVGYAFGWVEVAADAAEDAGDYAEVARERQRAALLYKRARDLALAVMRRRDAGIDAALAGKPQALAAYLDAHYADREEDVAPVFWASAAWGALIGMSDDVGLAIDMPAIKVMVEHVAKLDAGYEGAAALVFLGGWNAQYPAQFGGSPQKAKAYFERALRITGRRAHQVQLNYARFYALTMNDKPLFLSLLREIVDAPDRGSSVRLANKIARVRAERLLAKADTLL